MSAGISGGDVAPTIEDVARHAGVSRQTVSRVINGRNWVSEEARERVLAAVRALGYRRNALAGGLRSGRTNTIGLLISNILNPLFASEVRGVQDVAEAHGYQVILADTDEDVQKEEHLIDMLRQKQVDGAIVIPCHAASHAALTELQGSVDPGGPAQSCPAGLRLRHVRRRARDRDRDPASRRSGAPADRDHRRPRRSTTARERLSAYRKALQKNGMTYDGAIVTTTGYGTEDAHRATIDLMRLPQPPTAIFVTSALATLGVLSATQELGLLIPDDVALIGCNESLWAQFVTPPLTMIQTDPYAMGRTGAELLFRRLAAIGTTLHFGPASRRRSKSESFRAACRTPALFLAGSAASG